MYIVVLCDVELPSRHDGDEEAASGGPFITKTGAPIAKSVASGTSSQLVPPASGNLAAGTWIVGILSARKCPKMNNAATGRMDQYLLVERTGLGPEVWRAARITKKTDSR